MRGLRHFVRLLFGCLAAIATAAAQPAPYRATTGGESPRSKLLEQVHLHLNKTVFFPGERIWFKAYVFDAYDQMPSLETRNVYVGIYDVNGKERTRKLVRIEGGSGHNQIELDSTYNDAVYYVRATTTWMRNFPESKPFEQRIQMAGLQRDTIPNTKSRPEIRIYPEGRHFIAGGENGGVFWLANAGERDLQGLRAAIWDLGNEEQVVSVPLNEEGLGSFRFHWREGHRYVAALQLRNGSMLRQELKADTGGGYTLQVSTMDPNFVHARVQAIGSVNRSLRIRLRGGGTSEVREHRLEGDTLLISLPKHDLPYGINSIALLNGNPNPAVERSFFNEAGWTPEKTELNYEMRLDPSGDSLYLKLQTPMAVAEEYSLSLSVLPAESRAYRPQHSLFSSFYLRPYVDIPFTGHGIENLSRRSDLHAHDLRLRSRDDENSLWDNAFDPSEAVFPMEGNLNFSGRAPFADLQYEKQIWALTDMDKEYQVIDLENDKTFSGSGRLYLGDTLKVSVLSRGGILKRELVELDFEAPAGWALPIPSSQVAEAPIALNDLRSQEAGGMEEVLFQEDPDVIALEEVEVTERRENKEIQTRSALVIGKRVVGSDIERMPSLQTYLRKQGFKPRYEGGRLIILSRTPARGAQVGYIPVPVFLNGMLSDGTNLDIPLSNVESVFYDTNGLEFISVNLRLQNYYIANRERYSDFSIPVGYSLPEEYDVPSLKDPAGEMFRRYGQVYWVPELRIIPGTSSEIAIPLIGQEDLAIHLEGMGSDGSILQQTIRFQQSN